jgi:hypothetical protein
VVLRLDGELVDRRLPDQDRLSTHLAHPPFTFRLDRFQPGALEAIGLIGGAEAASHRIRTPGPLEEMVLALDESGRAFAVEGRDVAMLRAELRDAHGTTVPDAWENVAFGATGAITLVGANPFSSEAGIASVLVQAGAREPRGAVYALSVVREADRARVLSATLGIGGRSGSYDVRVTTDGTEPGGRSLRYAGPLTTSGRVRAALLVAGRTVFTADSDSPKFRIAGSTAPTPGP